MVKPDTINPIFLVLFCMVLFFAWPIACGDDDDDDDGDRGDSDIEGGGGGAGSGGGGGGTSGDDDDTDDDDDDDCENDCYETADCIDMVAYSYACGIVFEYEGTELTQDEMEQVCAQGYSAAIGCAVYCWQDSLDADCTEFAQCLATNCGM